MTFEKKFAEFKKELEKRNASELPTDLAMQVTMTDEDCGGIFYIANIGGNFAVEPYDYVDNTVNIAATAATLKDLLAGKLDGPDAMFRGLVEVNGNIEHALAVLGMKKKAAAKKPAAKKPAAKKTATKKAAAPKKAAEKKAAAPKKAAEKKAGRLPRRKPLLRRRLPRRKLLLRRQPRRKLLLRRLPRRKLRPRLPLRSRLPRRPLRRNKSNNRNRNPESIRVPVFYKLFSAVLTESLLTFPTHIL